MLSLSTSLRPLLLVRCLVPSLSQVQKSIKIELNRTVCIEFVQACLFAEELLQLATLDNLLEPDDALLHV